MEGPVDVAAIAAAVKEFNKRRDVMLLLEERGLVRRRKSHGRWYWTLTERGNELSLKLRDDTEIT